MEIPDDVEQDHILEYPGLGEVTESNVVEATNLELNHMEQCSGKESLNINCTFR